LRATAVIGWMGVYSLVEVVATLSSIFARRRSMLTAKLREEDRVNVG